MHRLWDDLHLVTGFELAEHGVYVAQADSLILFIDTDGDDRYDVKQYLASGFDDHDTHHKISAFCADPSGAIFMGEGTFLYSNVETVYGTNWTSDAGFYRYNPKRYHLERSAQMGTDVFSPYVESVHDMDVACHCATDLWQESQGA